MDRRENFWRGLSESNRVILLLGIAVGVLLRIYGIEWGLPNEVHPANSYHPDEGPTIAGARLLAKGHPYEKAFIYGGTLYSSILNSLFFFAGLFGSVLGQVNQLADTVLLGRYLMVVVAVLTIFLLYETGKKLFDRRVGLVAAIMLAICPAHIVWAQRLRPDEIAAFIALLIIYLAAVIFRSDGSSDRRYFVFVGLTVGAAIAFRFPLASFAVAPIAAYMLRPSKPADARPSLASAGKLIMTMGVCALLAYAITSPHSIIAFHQLITGLHVTWTYETSPFPSAVDRGPGIYQYGWSMLRQALGLPLYLLSVAAVAIALWKGTTTQRLLLVSIAPYFIIMVLASWVMVRYTIPLVPVLLLLSANAVVSFYRRYSNLRSYVVAVLSISAVFTMIANIAYLRVEASPHIQDVVADWIRDNIPERAEVATLHRYFGDAYFNPTITEKHKHRRVEFHRVGFPGDLFTEKPAEYLIIHEFFYGNMERLGPRHPQPEVRAFGIALAASPYRLLREFKQPFSFMGIDFSWNFSSEDYLTVNPGIRIYRYQS